MSNISLSNSSHRGSNGSISIHGRDDQNSLRPAAVPDQKPGFWATAKDKIGFALTTYRSSRELRVRNRYLGYMSTILIALILGYFIIYIFLIGRLYVASSKAIGSPFISLLGRSYFDSKHNIGVWQLTQQLTAVSKSSVTLPTRIRITKNQKLGACPSPIMSCKQNSDCNPNDFPNLNLDGKCKDLPNKKKGCEINGWCPAENVDDQTVTEVLNLEGVSEQKITVKSIMSFPEDPNTVYTGDTNQKNIDYPREGANTFSVENLLALAGTNYDSVKYIGCIIQLNIIWHCNADSGNCESTYEIKRMDGTNGYSQKHATYARTDKTTTRDEIHYSAIKIQVGITGISERISAYYIFIYFFIAVSLIYGVQIGTDFFLLRIAREKRHYSELKFENLRPDKS